MPKLNPRLARAALLVAATPAAILAMEAASNPQVAAIDPPEAITLVGTVRDFRERTASGGHPDFERQPARGFGHYCDNIDDQLGQDGKPVFKGGGFKIRNGYEWKNSAGKNICWRLYDSSRGDIRGRKDGTYTDPGGIQSAETFRSWFRDDLAYNVSAPLALTLVRQSNGAYVFDSNTDPACVALGGFFPLEGQLFGNPGGSPDRNFHFTYELHTEFTYDADGAQNFTFRGDDDVWVFIDGKMVIDLGGVHGAIEQLVELDRLGLEDGETYELAFFFAERHRTQSNFKITTNLVLETIEPPTVSAAYD